jgi:predicted aldo/keto reductase-like oxidoreductase
MNRRLFLQIPAAAGLTHVALAADTMPMATLGKSGLKVSRFCLGGYHMRVQGEANGIKMIHRAIDLGVNFLDSAHKYHSGESDITYGKALAGGLRQKVFMMTKAEKRDKASAMKQLEESLTRLKTDYLDLWQCHEIVSSDEVDKIFGPNGALEAFVQAKKEGKVRHIGFTGHHDPAIHLRVLKSFDGWETVQMPINLVDPHYLSFIDNVLPEVRKRGLGVLAMKSNAMGRIGKSNIAPITECLRFTASQNVDTVVSGPETIEQLEQNISVIKGAAKMSQGEMSSVLQRTKKGPIGSSIENYKTPESKAGLQDIHRDGEPDQMLARHGI